MKRSIKILLITLTSLLAVVALVLMLVSPIAKKVIEEHSKEWIGRQINVESLQVNLLNGHLTASRIVMLEADDKTTFASIDTLFLNVALYKLISKEVVLQQGRIVKPSAAIIQDGSTFNFSDLFQSDSTEQDTTQTSSSWVIDINKLALVKGNVCYTDKLLDNQMDLRAISLYIPSLRLGKGSTQAGLNLLFGEGSIFCKLDLDQENKLYQLHLKLKNIGIDIAKPYLQQSFNIETFKGNLDTDLLLSGSLEHLTEFSVSGNVALSDLNISTVENLPIVACRALSAQINAFDMSALKLAVGKVQIDDLSSSLIIDKNGNNYTRFLKQSQDTVPVASVDSTEQTPSRTFALQIDSIRVNNAEFTYEDLTLREPFRYPITKMFLSSDNFTLNGENNLKGHMMLGEGGMAYLRWNGSLESMANMQLKLGLKSVQTKAFSPYCVEYTGYPITEGTLNFEDETRIVNNRLVSKNSIDIYKLDVGNKLKNYKAKVNVPLRAGVYILTDRKGNIQFNVPVTGNIDDPKFKYGKIVWQTISNLLVKVTLSPASFIAESLGLKGGLTDKIMINPLSPGFTSEQYSELQQVQQVYQSKPEINIQLKQYIDTTYLHHQLALVLAKMEYYNQTHSDKITKLNDLSMDQLNEISNSKSEFVAYVDSALKSKGISSKGTLVEQCEQLISSHRLSDQADSLMMFRNRILMHHLTESMAIPASHLSVENATDSVLSNNKAYYQILYSLMDDGAEPASTEENE